MSKISKKTTKSSIIQSNRPLSHNSSTCTWKTRNDSKNVSSILNPIINDVVSDNETLKTPTQVNDVHYEKIVLESRPNSPKPPWIGPCKECYCHLKGIPPRLFACPPNCVSDEQTEERCPIHDELNTKIIDRNDIYCNHEYHDVLHKAKQVIDYEPKSNFLKNLQENVEKNCHCLSEKSNYKPGKLEFTESRANYENNRPLSIFEKDSIIEKDSTLPFKSSDNVTCDKFQNDSHNRCFFHTESDITEPNNKETNTTKKNSKSNLNAAGGSKSKLNAAGGDGKIDELLKFREKNFFDCFSTVTNQTTIPDHKCVHKFTINERLYPLPLNSDPYGVSRCAVCNQYMEQNKQVQTVEDKKLQTEKSKKSLSNISKRYQNNLMPKYLNIGTNKESVRVQVTKDRFSKELTNFRLPNFRCQPLNSLALRFQKGVMK